MIYRRNNLYFALFFVFLAIAILLVLGSSVFIADPSMRIAMFIVSGFVLVIAFTYFNLSIEDNKS